jgi:hypothetical protein
MDCMNGRTNCRKKLMFEGAGQEGAVVGFKGSCKCQTVGKWSRHQTPATAVIPVQQSVHRNHTATTLGLNTSRCGCAWLNRRIKKAAYFIYTCRRR